ncbi:hypothetical protein TIFTF001_018263 [Ficus carica]|uniref:Uncharacterized protein n=1 Tax=Ficus carica TaxID=3494 RepID=A0AA88AB30_FICCA|nr:hypothetical protein TIFTF001_018263 [Ficus carica]
MAKRTDGDVAVGALEHLVHALGAERGAEDASNGFAGGNVGLLSIEASQSGLLVLLFDYNERPPELVERQRHFFTGGGDPSEVPVGLRERGKSVEDLRETKEEV